MLSQQYGASHEHWNLQTLPGGHSVFFAVALRPARRSTAQRRPSAVHWAGGAERRSATDFAPEPPGHLADRAAAGLWSGRAPGPCLGRQFAVSQSVARFPELWNDRGIPAGVGRIAVGRL